MALIVTLLAAALALGAWAYVLREQLGAEGLGLAALRAAGLGMLALLLLDPSWLGRGAPGAPTVLLDRSLSLGVVGGQWERARDTAQRLAGERGRVLGFGATVGPLAASDPGDGESRLREALAVARSLGGPIAVVTDGEVTDLAAIAPQRLRGVEMVMLPRLELPGVALRHVDLPTVVTPDDSIPATVMIGTWGQLASAVRLEVTLDGRRLVAQRVDLPPPPTTARRPLVLPPRVLGAGTHVLAFHVAADGDAEVRDNVRLRAITVVESAPVVVILDPPDWDGRVLAATLADVSGLPVRGFARVTEGSWIAIERGSEVSTAAVRQALADASLVMIRGAVPGGDVPGGKPAWRWSVQGGTPLQGEWYLADSVPSSPLMADLARVDWGALPPLVAWRAVGEGWPVLTARDGRRGVAQPVIVGSTAGGRRELVTAADGFYRWVLRGGPGLEAFRTVIAAGTDWLLASDRPAHRAPIEVTRVVQRGSPVIVRWRGASPPESLAVAFRSTTLDTAVVLGFDAEGTAAVMLDPGTYRWQTDEHRGVTAVEEYSDEWLPRGGVAPTQGATAIALLRTETHLRQRWWVFVLIIVAFVSEWAWRQRRGLP